MGKQKILSIPDLKESLLYGSGFAIGFFSPGLFVIVINQLAQSELAGGYLNHQLKRIASQGVTEQDAAQGIIYGVLLIIAAVAVVKAAVVGKKLLLGVGVGILARIIVIYVLGIPLPTSPAVEYTTPMNETLNATANNTTVTQTFG